MNVFFNIIMSRPVSLSFAIIIDFAAQIASSRASGLSSPGLLGPFHTAQIVQMGNGLSF